MTPCFWVWIIRVWSIVLYNQALEWTTYVNLWSTQLKTMFDLYLNNGLSGSGYWWLYRGMERLRWWWLQTSISLSLLRRNAPVSLQISLPTSAWHGVHHGSVLAHEQELLSTPTETAYRKQQRVWECSLVQEASGHRYSIFCSRIFICPQQYFR